MRESESMTRPPEGVIKGESVPVGSEPDEIDRQEIENIMHELKTRGEPYMSMPEKELEERAIEIWNKGKGD